MLFASVLLACAAIAAAQPRRPEISESYTAKVSMVFNERNASIIGDGVEYRDAFNGRQLSHVEFQVSSNPGERYLTEIKRYDLGESYTVRTPPTECEKRPALGALPSRWGWLKNATYGGEVTVRHFPCDVWRVEDVRSGTKAELFVERGIATQPFMFVEYNTKSGTSIQQQYNDFVAVAPGVEKFEVPQLCK